MQSSPAANRLAFTVARRVKPGHIDAAIAITRRLLPAARQEPGLKHVAVTQRADNPAHFLFFEAFWNEAAFWAHQQTPHFRPLILEQALPLVATDQQVRYATL
jgi:quinol monooxygenase YgiN